jgi:hypothetical protein
VAITRDQIATLATIATGGTGPLTVSFTTPPAAGSKVILYLWGFDGIASTDPSSIVDNGSPQRTFTKAIGKQTVSTHGQAHVWYADNVQPSGSYHITITLTNNGGGTINFDAGAISILGAATGAPFATSSANADGVTSIQPGAAGSGNGNYYACTDYGGGSSPTINSPFTGQYTEISNIAGLGGDAITNGSQNPTVSASSGNFACVLAVWAPAAGGVVAPLAAGGRLRRPIPTPRGRATVAGAAAPAAKPIPQREVLRPTTRTPRGAAQVARLPGPSAAPAAARQALKRVVPVPRGRAQMAGAGPLAAAAVTVRELLRRVTPTPRGRAAVASQPGPAAAPLGALTRLKRTLPALLGRGRVANSAGPAAAPIRGAATRLIRTPFALRGRSVLAAVATVTPVAMRTALKLAPRLVRGQAKVAGPAAASSRPVLARGLLRFPVRVLRGLARLISLPPASAPGTVGAYDALYQATGAYDAQAHQVGAYDALFNVSGAYDREA